MPLRRRRTQVICVLQSTGAAVAMHTSRRGEVAGGGGGPARRLLKGRTFYSARTHVILPEKSHPLPNPC